ncbi:hypothetical protein MPH_10959 [Macrophomina phaseolina MS6]|uniref:Glucose receptor Git3-like N-terminal domain-containing protein n=1 Tax=Macrophomina phaseolina (strain MS6) TaxID=1126212 RepID=K2QPS8_MACPH|nr:hypothetical protein MPH_10959 [Macrophomina phaseolina MS6]
MGWDPAVSIPTLVGSVLSFVASTIIFVFWAAFGGQRGGERRSFRYALILNLTFAEWVNSLNNSVSGLYIVTNHGKRHLEKGPACELNGYMGQISVQAVDCSILAIAVVTLLTIQFKSYILYASLTTKILICISVWILPIITSFTALGLDLYQPVSGNWCWITPKPVYLRYALTHGWRFAIILVTICIYAYVFVYMHRRLRLRNDTSRSYSFDYGNDVNGFEMNFRMNNDAIINGRLAAQQHHEKDVELTHWSSQVALVPAGKERDLVAPPSVHASEQKGPITVTQDGETINITPPQTATGPPVAPPRIRVRQTANIDRDVWRMVLLNLYPIFYVILWIPGISNRIVEATGGRSRVLAILQSSTQYTGLVNALVYGFREHWEDIKIWWRHRR